jgi:hypothetical protein
MGSNFLEKTITLYKELHNCIDKKDKLVDLSFYIKINHFKELNNLFKGTPVIKNYIQAIKDSESYYNRGYRVEINPSTQNLELKKEGVVLKTRPFIKFEILKVMLKGDCLLDRERDLVLEILLFDPNTVLTLNYINLIRSIKE